MDDQMDDQINFDKAFSDMAEQVAVMNRECNRLQAALDRADADKAAAVEAERERCAALIDCGGCYDYPCCNPPDCNAILAAAIRTGAKP